MNWHTAHQTHKKMQLKPNKQSILEKNEKKIKMEIGLNCYKKCLCIFIPPEKGGAMWNQGGPQNSRGGHPSTNKCNEATFLTLLKIARLHHMVWRPKSTGWKSKQEKLTKDKISSSARKWTAKKREGYLFQQKPDSTKQLAIQTFFSP